MSDSIHVEYNERFKPLETLLQAVTRAGDFFATGSLEVPMPRVELDGVGTLSFAVPDFQAQALMRQATRAPYGRGEETILDESVRKVWQLPPSSIRIGGKFWADTFECILSDVITGLSCESGTVKAELYKVLVYDTGGFFLSHRDTEKVPGMFGTLVVVLPSAHQGGELIIRHAGREVTLDLSGADVSEIRFAAFYADCEHEVRPITSGNRVCLVYNLIRATKAGRASLHAPDYTQQVADAAGLLRAHFAETDAPKKIAWLLEHQYSPEGLAFAALKAADAARVQVLRQAAELADCAIHLGILHIEEAGSAESHYYHPRRWRRYFDDDEDGDNDDEDCGSGDFDVVEVFDQGRHIGEWRNLQDEPVPFGSIPLCAGELLPAGGLNGERPDKQRLMEASGNEGATFERSYHRAVVVIWPRARYGEILLQGGADSALPYLKECIAAATARHAPASGRAKAVTLAQKIARKWQEEIGDEDDFYPADTSTQRAEILRLLTKLGDIPLLDEFFSRVILRCYDGSENAACVAAAKILAPKRVETLFSELMRRHMAKRPRSCVQLLQAFTKRFGAAKAMSDALAKTSEAAVVSLDQLRRIDRSLPEPTWERYCDKTLFEQADSEFVATLMNALGAPLQPAARASAATPRHRARPTSTSSSCSAQPPRPIGTCHSPPRL